MITTQEIISLDHGELRHCGKLLELSLRHNHLKVGCTIITAEAAKEILRRYEEFLAGEVFTEEGDGI